LTFPRARCWSIFLLAPLVAGCGEVTDPPRTATLRLAIVEGGFGEGAGEPLEGVNVCETDTTNCALTNEFGHARLELPIGREISYTLEKDGHASYLVPDVFTPAGSQYLRALPPDEFMVEQHAAIPSPYPMRGTGTILISTDLPILEGATFELIDATGNRFYVEEELGRWSPLLDETTSNGRGGFTEVTPGVYQIRFGGAAQSCELRLSWFGEERDIMKVPVREGFVTRAAITCLQR